MNRTLLIARREFMAYAKTVGFWLSLLAFPIFGALGGSIPLLMDSNQPERAVVMIDDTARTGGGTLEASVRASLAESQRQAEIRALRMAAVPQGGAKAGDRVRTAAETGGTEAGLAALRAENPGAAEGFTPPRPAIRLVAPPADLAGAKPGPARDALVRRYLDEETPVDGQPLNAVVFLREEAGAPAATVWTARPSDDTAEDAIEGALVEANRDRLFASAGIDRDVVQAATRFRPTVSVFSPATAEGQEVSFRDRLPGVIGLGVGFILWSLVITGASILLNSVMEEKSNKILEVLLSSASSTEILAGKVLGVALLTLSVLVVWGALGGVGLALALPDIAADIGSVLGQGGLLVYFALYMIGGYLMYAVLFAAIGSFCDTPRDAQTLMGPIMMVLVIPILVMQFALQNPDAPLIKFLSWVPFFTPFLMSARVPSEPPLIEVIGTLGGMFAFALLMVWLAGRAFRAGALSDVKLSWKSFAGAMRGNS